MHALYEFAINNRGATWDPSGEFIKTWLIPVNKIQGVSWADRVDNDDSDLPPPYAFTPVAADEEDVDFIPEYENI
eukprot:2312881-Rhodomonas_salina.1